MDCGADLNALDNTNSTPLHLASTHGTPDVARLLIERGAGADVACLPKLRRIYTRGGPDGDCSRGLEYRSAILVR